jgi:hypothetical protein
MRQNSRNIMRLAALAICVAVIAWTSQAVAQEEGSVMVDGPTVAPENAAPTLPPPADVAAPALKPEPAPATAAKPAEVAKPCIDYRTHRSARRMLRCNPHVKVMMVAQNPVDCCLHEIPLCIPACCTGEPRVFSECGVLGRGTVTYCWPDCSFEVTVIFRARGDVVVDYRG